MSNMSEATTLEQTAKTPEAGKDKQVPEAPQRNEAVEREARLYGWVPREEFRGSDDEWSDAEAFVKRGKEINPILRKNNETLLKRIERMERDAKDKDEAIKEFREYHAKTEERAYKRALESLKAQKKEAIKDGDADAVIEIEDQIDELKAEQEQKKRKPAAKQDDTGTDGKPAMDPVFVSWAEENSAWFGKDRRMSAYAEAIGAAMRQDDDERGGREFLDAVAEEVRAAFPDKFGNPRRAKAGMVEGGGGSDAPAGKRKKTAADLPADARAAMNKYVKQGLLTEEQYLKDYFGGEGE